MSAGLHEKWVISQIMKQGRDEQDQEGDKCRWKAEKREVYRLMIKELM